MSFLTPWFLAGLLALALPLWLHRLEKQTQERRPWSSLAFFRPTTESSTRQRRYRYLMLLACRLLLLALLALLFARPALDARSALSPPATKRHVVAVDTSLSMGHDGLWARAVAETERLLGTLGGADRSQLVAFGPGVRILGGASSNHGAWRASLRSLKPTVSRASYGELGEAVRALAEDEPGPLVLHVVSDFQRSAAPERFADLGLPAGTMLEPHDVAGGARPNWSLETVTGRMRLHGEERGELQATIAGFDTPSAARRVELRIGTRVIGSTEVQVPASGRAIARFGGFEVPRGHSRAVLEMQPADEMTADDRFFVALERTDSLPVLFVRDAGDARAELYYRTALESGGAGVFELHSATPEAAQSLALDRFAFAIVYDQPRLPALLETRLRAFVEGGRAALVVAGGATARVGRLPWWREAVADAGRRDRGLLPVGSSSHPIVPASERLGDVRFFRHVRAAATPERVLVRLSDGAPLLFESSLGGGRVLFLASPFDTAWNEWPIHASFVPFAVRSARWLAGLEGARTQALVDDVLDMGQGASAPAASTEVIGPDGRRALGLAASVAERRLALDQAGFYEIRRPGRTDEVAVNPDPRESDLRPLEPEAVARWKATGSAAPSERAPLSKPEPRELARYVAWILVAIVMIESTLANAYLRR